MSSFLVNNTPIARLHDEFALSVLSRAPELAKTTLTPPLINLGIGQPNFPVDQHILDAVAKAAKDTPYGYGPAMGRPETRSAVASYCRDTLGYSVDNASVIATPGGKGGIFMVMTGLLRPNDEVLIPVPAFPAYISCAHFASAKVVHVPLSMDHPTISADDYISRLSDRTRLIVINSPSNPTGQMMPEAEVRKLAKALENYPNCFVLADEVYSRQILGSVQHFSCYHVESWRNRLFVIDSLSKCFAMTGWRFGWVIFPEGMGPAFERYAINGYSNLPGIVESAAVAALSGPQSAVAERTQAYKRRADQFYNEIQALDNLTCQQPLGGFYCYVNFSYFASDGMKDRDLTDKLTLESGLLTIPGFGFSQPSGCFVRFSLAVADEQITETCRRLQIFCERNS